MVIKTVAAGLFKQGCLALLDEVGEGGVELVVTKRGRPVARVVPVTSAADRDAATLATLRSGTRTRAPADELLRPSTGLAAWDALGEQEKGKSRRARGKRA